MTLLCLAVYGLIAWTIGYYVWRYWRELEELPDADRKAVLITGCDSGFGNGAAKRCLRHGMTVFASCATEKVSARGSGSSDYIFKKLD